MSFLRWAPCASIAVLVHIALFWAMARQRPAATFPRGDATARDELAFEVLDEGRPSSSQERPTERHPVQGGDPSIAKGLPAAMRETVPPSAGEASDGPVQGELSSRPADDGWTFRSTKALELASPESVARAARDVAIEGSDQPTASVGRLAEALDQHDADIGLGRGGPVLSALESASRNMDVPVEGWALFDVGIEASGRLSVALTDAANDRAAWTRVARAAGAAVDPKGVRIPPGARGWHVTVRIDAKMQFPDGLKPKDLGTRFEATPGKVSATSMVLEKLPGSKISMQGTVCGASLSMTILGPVLTGGCDPENASTHAVRVVSGRIVSEGS